ncbi:MAG: 4-(cytidine 5'-diphospho)-2-C-methyl-D-erythritol kinase [Bacteroidetes bacterium]|nr:4-(cytidine 5'-diphospho)-2-C-methyl-D-erythritol kinase [Bacteroidota bacterium]
MIVFPNAKINLGLNIIEKRTDSFHNIETVFLPIKLCDALEIVAVEQNTSFESSGVNIPPDNSDNLCLNAYKLLKNQYNLPNVKIHLHKAIPVGAGLGGGSSDAAFTIRLLNDLFALNLGVNKMKEYAANLGSDCSFFIENKASVATGRGEILEDVDLELNGKFIVVVKPEIHISTAMAYSLINPVMPEKSIKSIIKQPIDTWKEELKNDFESPLMSKYSIIQDIKSELYKDGAVYASMSGSGSSVFGIYNEKPTVRLKTLFPSCFYWSGLI